MPSDSEPAKGKPLPPETKKAKAASNNVALALELPFTLAGAIGIGVALGYFLDKWLHTRAVFTVILGGLGFIAGVREVIRRLPGTGDGTNGN
jgi:ATP synthase protein I